MVYRECVRRGIQIAKDISLIFCNNELPLLTGLYPEVTTIDACAQQIGRQAVEQLIWRLDHPGSLPRKRVRATTIGGRDVGFENCREPVMKTALFPLLGVVGVQFAMIAIGGSHRSLLAHDDLPIVPDGFTVDVFAAEPMVRNPCVMAFDRLGRICVAQGPQWPGPTPETPGDRIDILIDRDEDGIADAAKTFAEGFNSIQGIAWHGNDLWIANAPDRTVVRDTDDDDQADVYTGLGNLEHSLHGLNFGPDGKLYSTCPKATRKATTASTNSHRWPSVNSGVWHHPRTLLITP